MCCNGPNSHAITRAFSLLLIGLALLFFFPTAYAQEVIIDINQTWDAGTYEYQDVLITNNATLTLQCDPDTGEGVTLIVDNLTIESSSSISSNGKGYPGGSGPGRGGEIYRYGGGGGYGGEGSAGSSAAGGTVYGSPIQPVDLGSGGGNTDYVPGGAGGGLIIIECLETLIVDGDILANGHDGGSQSSRYSGGGSGGSIYIVTGTLAGSGRIAANGGSGGGCCGGGGGGGRIAIYYTTNNHTGTLSAYGGFGDQSQYGAAGTIFTKADAQVYGELLVDNDNNPGAMTWLSDGTYDLITVRNKARLALVEGSVVSVTGLVTENEGTFYYNTGTLNPTFIFSQGEIYIDKGISPDEITIGSGGRLYVNVALAVPVLTLSEGAEVHVNQSLSTGDITIPAGGAIYLNGMLAVSNLTIADGGILTHASSDPDFRLTVTYDLNVLPGGSIDVSGKGYPGGSGPGRGGEIYRYGGGGGYGGEGSAGSSAAGGTVYGSPIQPVDLGSGGGNTDYVPGGAGGGLIIIECLETLIVDGDILANGHDGGSQSSRYSGGGSGGSIYIVAGTLAGSGRIAANGGNGGGCCGGGGGGGRIAIYYTNNNHTGTLSAYGGFGYQSQYGAAGTIFTKAHAQVYGDILLDNNNNPGAITWLSDGTYDLITVRNKARLALVEGSVVTVTGLVTENEGTFYYNTGTLNPTFISSQGEIYIDKGISPDEITIGSGGRLYVNTALAVPVLTLSGGAEVYVDQSLSTGDVTIPAGGAIYLNGMLTVSNLTITDGGILTHASSDPDFRLTVTKNLNVLPGGGIDVSGKGYPGGSGPGRGGETTRNGGGAGYGGEGGAGSSSAGGMVYGSPIQPADLGSGGGNTLYALGGAGGGLVIIECLDTLTVDGDILANGHDGRSQGAITCYSGGGSGGSIYIVAGTLAGSGHMAANGGNGGLGVGGGGGGGRIAVYYTTNSYVGSVTANGGTGHQNGEDGTVLTPILSVDAPITAATMNETMCTSSSFVETLLVQEATLNNVEVKGDLNGTLNFSKFELIGIQTGSFAGKGFSKGEWQATIEGANYAGDWRGMFFLRQNEERIYLKGVVSGEISGIVEGFLTESDSGSGIYDQYRANWKLIQVGVQTVSGAIDLQGTITDQTATEYPATGMYALQTSIEGTTRGHYTGPLSTVLTHVRVMDEGNPYHGEGFSIISYHSDSGQGEGWTYDNLAASRTVELRGIFSSPLLGCVCGTLDETRMPRSLFLTIARIDFGLPPMADVKVRLSAQGRVSPGQRITYVIELRNDGTKIAEDITLVGIPPILSNVVGATAPGMYDDVIHMIRWDFPEIPAQSTRYLSFQAEVLWGLAWGTELISHIHYFSKEEADSIFEHSTPGLSEEGKGILKAWWRLSAKAIPAPWGSLVSLANAAAEITQGALLAAYGRARLEYYQSLLDGQNEDYWLAMMDLLNTMATHPERLQDGWETPDGEISFTPDMTLNDLISTLREHYDYTPRVVPEQTAVQEVAVAHDPNLKYGIEGHVLSGQKLDYRVEYENEGEGIAFGVYFADTLDEDLNDSTLEIGPVISIDDGSIIASSGTYNPTTRTITWFVGEVGPGEGGYADFSVNVRSDADPGAEIINFATVYFPSVPEATRTNGVVSAIPLNQPPVANAGPDQSVECSGHTGTPVQLDGSGSNDPDGDPLIFTWSWEDGSVTGVSPIETLPFGTSMISLVVNDGTVDSEPDTVIITIIDETAPELVAPPDITVECLSNTGQAVDIGTATATDTCCDVIITHNSPPLFYLGETVVTWTAVDCHGNSSMAVQKVTVQDTIPPDTSVTFAPDILWPPNHKMIEVITSIQVSDVCCATDVAVELVAVQMNEGDTENTFDPLFDIDPDSGYIGDDIQIVDGRIFLRAERAGKSSGRVYTLTYRATDCAGNTSTAIGTVTVPHDNR